MAPPTSRPKFLNLLYIRLPITAVVSLLHRASGLLLFVLLPGAIALLDLSLRDRDGFAAALALLQRPWGRLLLWAGLWALLHHLAAGVRLLLADLDRGIELPAARAGAWAVTVAAPLLTLACAVVLP